MDFDKIERVLTIMKENKLSEFTYEESDKFKLTLKQGSDAPVAFASAPAAGQAPAASAPAVSASVIESPIVGTFYASPSPDAENYIKVGDEFQEGSILCIVEAMKVMNEIKAEFAGKITKILVEDGSPVEYGQALFEYSAL